MSDRRLPPWTIHQLERAYQEERHAGRYAFERAVARAAHAIDIQRLADQIAATRRLTPGERAIAESYGWREQAPPQERTS